MALYITRVIHPAPSSPIADLNRCTITPGECRMSEAVQHESRGLKFESSAPSTSDMLRVFALIVALSIIAFRCYTQYRANRQLASNPVVYLHLRSLDGYRSGVPVYLAKRLSSRPRGFLLIPSQSSELLSQRRLWNSAMSTIASAGLFPIIVCTDSSCPLSEGENPSHASDVVVLDRLQYIPSLALADAAEKHHALLLNASMIVQHELTRPESIFDINALATLKASGQ